MCKCSGSCGCNITQITKGEKGDVGATGETGPEGPAGTLGYLVYTGLLSQDGINNPTVIVLENTLGAAVVWTYDSVGSYLGTLAGAFNNTKTFIQVTPIDYSRTYDAFVNDVNSVYIEQAQADGSSTPVDNLVKLPVEIRVYP